MTIRTKEDGAGEGRKLLWGDSEDDVILRGDTEDDYILVKDDNKTEWTKI